MLYGIGKLAEETSEVGVEIGKLIAFPDGNHPDGKGHLYERLENEMADAFAAIKYMMLMNPKQLNMHRFADRVDTKLEIFMKWGLVGLSSDPPTPE